MSEVNRELRRTSRNEFEKQMVLSYNSLQCGRTTRTKFRVFHSNVKSVLLYGSETWKEMKTTISKLQTFVIRCLRRILKIHSPEVISYEEL